MVLVGNRYLELDYYQGSEKTTPLSVVTETFRREIGPNLETQAPNAHVYLFYWVFFILSNKNKKNMNVK